MFAKSLLKSRFHFHYVSIRYSYLAHLLLLVYEVEGLRKLRYLPFHVH